MSQCWKQLRVKRTNSATVNQYKDVTNVGNCIAVGGIETLLVDRIEMTTDVLSVGLEEHTAQSMIYRHFAHR